MTYLTPVAELAWPLAADTYRYFTNVTAARTPVITAAGSWGSQLFEVDSSYRDVMATRAQIVADQPHRCSTLPHMEPAAWETLLFGLTELGTANPATMRLSSLGDDRFGWENDALGVRQPFTFGDAGTLPAAPLTYLASQVQEDLFLLDQRDDHLHVDGVAATFTGSWSSSFSLGMSFSDLHGPVPRLHAMGMVDRTEKFLMALAPGEAFRRTNWSVYDSEDLDASLESHHRRDPGRIRHIVDGDRYGELRLRVEVQHLVRMPSSEAILFTIKTHLTSFAEVATVEVWRSRLRSVLAELPSDMADYKGLGPYRDGAVRWLDTRARRL